MHKDITKAQQIFADLIGGGKDEIGNYLHREIQAGNIKWVLDPEVDGVVGLVKTGTNQAVAVFYIEDWDIELAEEVLDNAE